MDEQDKITILLEGDIRVVEIQALKPNPDNPKDISKGLLDKLTQSLGHLGYIVPILVNKDMQIIDGHQRIKALKAMGYERVQVRVVDLDEDKELLALLATDQTYGNFDRKKRQEIYDLLEQRNAKLDILADYVKRKDDIFDPDEEPNQIVEIHDDTEIKYGDVIKLGKHLLICGDSTDPAIHDIVRENGSPYLICTSPPYLNQREEYATWDSVDAYLDDMKEVFKLSTEGHNDMVVALNMGMDLSFNLPAKFDEILTECGLIFEDMMAWVKKHPNMDIPRYKNIRGSKTYYPAFKWEPIMIYNRGNRHKFDSLDTNEIHENFLTNVWEFDTIRGDNRWHPAPYPIELAKTVLMCYSSPSDLVLDPFVGSGTTIFAAEEVGRKSIGIELSPEYCMKIVEIWNDKYVKKNK